MSQIILRNLKVGTIAKLPISLIKPNPDQPRKLFHEESLHGMAASYGDNKDVEYPIMVIVKKDHVIIVDGERRWRAAQIAGLEIVSCQIRKPMTDDEIFLTSAKANLCRENMSPIEEAFIIKRFQETYKWSQGKIGQELGKSQAQICQILKFLDLHAEIQALLLYGKIDKGIAFQLTTYKQEHQKKLLDILEAEVEQRGGPIHPNEAARILRKNAEYHDIKPKKRKKGKYYASHTEMVLKNVLAKGCQLKKALQELKELKAAQIQEDQIRLKDIHCLDVLDELRRLDKLILKEIGRLEKLE